MPERREEAEKFEIIFQLRRIRKQLVRVVKSMGVVKGERVVNSMLAHGHAGRREKREKVSRRAQRPNPGESVWWCRRVCVVVV